MKIALHLQHVQGRAKAGTVIFMKTKLTAIISENSRTFSKEEKGNLWAPELK